MKELKRAGIRIRSKKHLRLMLGLTDRELDRVLDDSENFYRFWQRERGGKIHQISEPREPLKSAQKRLNALLQHLDFSDCLQGGLKGRSTKTNAMIHCGREALLKADISEFFKNVSPAMVEEVFHRRLECSREVSKVAAKLCTVQGHLPEGAPTSTALANLVIEKLAKRLSGLAVRHDANYSQFVDDVALSGPKHLNKLEHLVVRIIESEGFQSNPKKLVTLIGSEEKVVTGIRVDQGIDVPSQKLRLLRAELVMLREEIEHGVRPGEKRIASLHGKISYIARFNAGAGRYLRRQLLRTIAA